jgi:hypothetical protein
VCHSNHSKTAIDFALYSPTISVCQTLSMLHLYSVFARAWPQPMRPWSSALVGEWSRLPSPEFVHPGCTAMARKWDGTNRIYFLWR